MSVKQQTEGKITALYTRKKLRNRLKFVRSTTANPD